MSESVCALCLTADRQRLTDRAVKCFLDQTAPAWMLIYDTGKTPYDLSAELAQRSRETGHRIVIAYDKLARTHKIGRLRNDAIQLTGTSEIIVHWDSDDWSDPRRLEVQLANIKQTGVTCFLNMLFYDTRALQIQMMMQPSLPGSVLGDAYEYDTAKCGPRNVIGTSLMYRRCIWESHPFNQNAVIGEDTQWARMITTRRVECVSAPLMIAEVHGGNSSYVYKLAFDEYQPAHRPEWRRRPEFDQFCREKLYP